ncbi:hypothetical protein ACFLQO_00830 [Candidatus Aenigmatarchaeota archaeon]
MGYISNPGVVGKAYGFFDRRAPKNEIEGLLPKIRKLVKTPSEVDLSLIDDMDNITKDSYPMSIAKDAKNAGIKYALEATYPGATNRETADEVAAILIQTYQTHLYDEGESFRGEIVFEENGKYVFRD